MRSFILSLAALAALTSPAKAEDDPHSRDRTKETPTTYVTLELQGITAADADTVVPVPDLNGTIARLLKGPFGAYTFFYVDRDYAEALVGPLFAPTDWLVISAGAGIEQWPTGSWRIGGMVWLDLGSVASTTFVETGASGFWARSEFAWRPRALFRDRKGTLGLGFLADTLFGAGPRVEMSLPETPIQFWEAVMIDLDGKSSAAIGLRLNI